MVAPLGLFFATALACAYAYWVQHRVLTRHAWLEAKRLAAEDVAYLNRGGRLAVCASLAKLRAAGAVAAQSGGVLRAEGPLPERPTDLDTAIHDAATRGVRATNLGWDPAVRSALRRIKDGLTQGGYFVTAAQRRTMVLTALLPVAVVGAGVAWLVADVRAGRPVADLIMLLFILAVAALVVLGLTARGRTAAVAPALERLRRSNDHLAPGSSPSITTYGAPAAALAVGLFGTASLHSMDRAFASAAAIERDLGAPFSDEGSGGGSTSCGSGT